MATAIGAANAPATILSSKERKLQFNSFNGLRSVSPSSSNSLLLSKRLTVFHSVSGPSSVIRAVSAVCRSSYLDSFYP